MKILKSVLETVFFNYYLFLIISKLKLSLVKKIRIEIPIIKIFLRKKSKQLIMLFDSMCILKISSKFLNQLYPYLFKYVQINNLLSH